MSMIVIPSVAQDLKKGLPLLNYRVIHGEVKLWIHCRKQLYLKLTVLFVSSQASNGQWYQMNDSLVHSSNIKVVLNQQAYVLFYLR